MEIENTSYYLNQLHEQVSLLIDACHNYDLGKFYQAKAMSSVIRTIVKDPENPRPNNKTISLLTRLNKKDVMKFYNTGFEVKDPIISINLVGIVSVPSKPPAKVGQTDNIYLPLLNTSQQIDIKWLSFNDWWKSKIIVYKSEDLNIEFSRKSMVLTMAENDGGSHIDSIEDIDINYLDLATATKSLLMHVDKNGLEFPIINIHFALVRQISHELIISLIKEFNLQIDYNPTNKFNLRGISENKISNGMIFVQGDKIESTRTNNPYKLQEGPKFTAPENAAYIKLFL